MSPKTHRTGRMLLVAGLAAVAAGSLAAHELFLKLSTYFLPPDTAVQALLLNGTFVKSEGPVTRDRIADYSLVSPGGRTTLDTTAITPRGDSTHLRFRTAGPGTYVMGLSVKPREIALTGEQFNGYLKEEGLDEVLAERTRTGTLGTPAKERYAKHVKAVFQVGDARSHQFGTVLGYPAEIVPLENPYELKPGGTLRVRCLVNGQPAAGLVVLAGGTSSRGTSIGQIRATSDTDGVARVPLGTAGRWYVKFISMRKSDEGDLTHESQWATLTFQIR